MKANELKLARFGDKFFTEGGQKAIFLRRAYNSENEFAFLYIEGWGELQYYIDGRCVNDKMPYYNIERKVALFKKDE